MGKNRRFNKRWLLFVIFLPFFIIAFIIGLSQVLLTYRNYLSAEKEYAQLEQHSPIIYVSPESENIEVDEPDINPEDEPAGGRDEINQSSPLYELNEEYIGWIRVPGTNIDYPVVQAADNIKYLRRTFLGEGNQSGTIFMDYRIAGFDAPFILLYGHNMHDGSMFAALEYYLDNEYLLANPEIIIGTLDGEILYFKIFAVKIVNIEDKIFDLIGQDEQAIVDYLISIDAPESSMQLFILSTCIGNNNDERLLILSIPN